MKPLDQKQENAPTMEEILQSIRGVMSEDIPDSSTGGDGDDEDILELTEIVGPGSNVTPSTGVPPKEVPSSQKPPEKGDTKVISEIENKVEEVATMEPKIAAENNAEVKVPASQEKPNNIEATNAVIKENLVNNDPVKEQAAISPAIIDTKPSKPEEAILPTLSKEGLLSEKVTEEASNAIKDLMEKSFKPQVQEVKFRSGKTLEDLIIESLKPELSNWLNQNLPSIVKSLVEKEIKKIVPKND